MRAVVAYESMYGNTRAVAERIAAALGRGAETQVQPVGKLTPADVVAADLVVIGAPTHAFGMSRPSTRQAARDAVAKPGSDLALEPDAVGIGVREWVESLPSGHCRVAVFDTRVRMPGVVGHASRPLARAVTRRGYELFARPQSFFVTKQNTLLPGELDRAETWADSLLVRAASFAAH
jgi:hypothetical protein